MKNPLNKLALIAGLAVIPALAALAQPYYIAGSGITPNWTTIEPGATPMSGGPTVYTITLPTVTNGYHDFKAAASNWVSSWPNNNIMAKGDANGSNTFYFFPGTTVDGWLPLNNRVGYADPGNMTWGIIGAFNGWTTDVALNSIGSGVYSNSIVVAMAGTYEFKFRTPGTWAEVRFGVDFGNDNANGSFTTTNSPQTVPVQLDLPNGRYLVGEPAAPPVTNEVVFAVDMSVEILLGRFVPDVDRVAVSGAFNGWPGTGTNALTLTNVPTWNGGANTNIYYATNTFVGSPSSSGGEYKFVDTNPALNGSSGYEPLGPNRSFSLLSSNGVLALPLVNFGNTVASDYLAADTLVTFRVDMNGAQTGIPATTNPPVPFNAGTDTVFVNGTFLAGSWIQTWNPISLAPVAMTDSGGLIYTFTYLVPKGNLVRVQYKYGFDNTTVLPIDNEAPSGQDHVRYIRTTATGSYVMPIDTYGVQYNEPSFGGLAVGTPSGGTFPVQWLGRPGVTLQSTASLTGTWTDHIETDGTNWSAGTSTTNGLLSSTNWPVASGNEFFRLIKQ